MEAIAAGFGRRGNSEGSYMKYRLCLTALCCECADTEFILEADSGAGRAGTPAEGEDSMSNLLLFLFVASASAAMDKDTIKATQESIDAAYQPDKVQCASLKGNARDVCVTQAKAARVRVKADARANQEVIRKRDADSAIALERLRLEAQRR